MSALRLRLGMLVALAVAAATGLAAQSQSGATEQGTDAFRFKSGVELVNVTATVSDDNGHFVSGLTKDDFVVYDDGALQEITNFSNERVPVSLGILLDTSGSMTPEKMSAARSAIDRFIYELLDKDDELFFMQFASVPDLLQGWTYDRRAISRAVANIDAAGGTAMYDAIARALPIAAAGRNQKKAILVISDGNDTNSSTSVTALRSLIRESEVMVYALGVDGTDVPTFTAPPRRPTTPRFPIPIPGGRGRFPGGRFPFGRDLQSQVQFPPLGGGGGRWGRGSGERVNESALRSVTDDTGGRTEIVRGFGDLNEATEHIADELSKRYYLGYNSPGKSDGRWHAIRVELKDKHYSVRARRGYVAS